MPILVTLSGMTMLVVTHEMDFAKDVSNRVFYMDEKGIYEDGTPSEIFGSPRKPKTKKFIHNIRSLHCKIENHEYDFAEMLGFVENFCFNHAIDKKVANKLQLITEELIVHIIVPKFGNCELEIRVSEKLDTYQFIVSYTGEQMNVLESGADELSMIIVKNCTSNLQYEYEAGINTIKAEVIR